MSDKHITNNVASEKEIAEAISETISILKRIRS